MSRKKKVRLGDSEPDEHWIVFYKAQLVSFSGKLPDGAIGRASPGRTSGGSQ